MNTFLLNKDIENFIKKKESIKRTLTRGLIEIL